MQLVPPQHGCSRSPHVVGTMHVPPLHTYIPEHALPGQHVRLKPPHVVGVWQSPPLHTYGPAHWLLAQHAWLALPQPPAPASPPVEPVHVPLVHVSPRTQLPPQHVCALPPHVDGVWHTAPLHTSPPAHCSAPAQHA